MIKYVAPFALLLLATPSVADEAEAETCLRTKVWDGYADGWGIRTMTTAELGAGETRNYLVTFYPNKEYQIQTCADGAMKDLDVVLYDLEGKVKQRDSTSDREPIVTLKTDVVTTYYVVLHAKELTKPDAKAGVAIAVTYR